MTCIMMSIMICIMMCTREGRERETERGWEEREGEGAGWDKRERGRETGRGRGRENSFMFTIFFFIQSDQDSNYGKPWFHGSISREEANELLMRRKHSLIIPFPNIPFLILHSSILFFCRTEGEVGSFLLRKAGSPGGEDVVRYSLSVRTLSGVQRFLIQKYMNGYYLFGGRPFNS